MCEVGNSMVGSDTPPMEATCREQVETMLAGLSPDVVVSVALGASSLSGDLPILLSVAMKGFELRMAVEAATLLRDGGEAIADLVRQRVREAREQELRFLRRIDDARGKLQLSLERNGDMRLVALEMRPAPVEEAFSWHDCMLEARIETLDELLQPKVERLHDFTARAMAGAARHIGISHKRRLKAIERLARLGAVFEIDRSAEDAILKSGSSISRMAQPLLAEGRTCLEGSHDPRDMIILYEGRVAFSTCISRTQPARPVMADELVAA